MRELRAMRDRIGPARWETWLELAREAYVGDDSFVRFDPRRRVSRRPETVTSRKTVDGEEFAVEEAGPGTPRTVLTEASSLEAGSSLGRPVYEMELASARSQLAAAKDVAVKNAKESRVALLELREALEARDREVATAKRDAEAARAERDALLERLSRRPTSVCTPRASEREARHNVVARDRMEACLRRLDAARGAALLAAALAADARQAPDAMAAAEEHLRAFAACAVDFATSLATALATLPDDIELCCKRDESQDSFRDAFADHLKSRARSSVGGDARRDDVADSPRDLPDARRARAAKLLDDDEDAWHNRGLKVWKTPTTAKGKYRAWR